VLKNPPDKIPLKTIVANHVSKFVGIARDGNRVFNDQIVSNGLPIISSTTTKAMRNTFIPSAIMLSPEQSVDTNLQTLHAPLLLVCSFACGIL